MDLRGFIDSLACNWTVVLTEYVVMAGAKIVVNARDRAGPSYYTYNP